MLAFIVNAAVACAVFYNIHHSLKAQDKASRKFYKHYFVVLALLLVVDNVFAFILHRIPYYQFFKLFLLVWLSIPGGTGPRFIYNVYIRNIYQLFEGDIDSVINNFRQYYADLKAKYHDAVSSKKKGELSFNFKNKSSSKAELHDAESSDVEVSSAAMNDIEEAVSKKE